MYYEINVSFNGIHLFATHKRSITDLKTCKRLVRLFVEKFPASTGYHIGVSRYSEAGKILDVNELLENL